MADFQAYLLLAIKISAWPTKTLKPPQPKPTIGYNFVNRAYGHPGGAGYRRGWVVSAGICRCTGPPNRSAAGASRGVALVVAAAGAWGVGGRRRVLAGG